MAATSILFNKECKAESEFFRPSDETKK